MSGIGLAGAAAIAGIGQTEFSKQSGRSETQLAAEAIRDALADCGLVAADVDGLVSYTIDKVEEVDLVRSIGIQELGFSSRVPYGGGGSMGVLVHAAAAVASGAADVVVGYRALNARSGSRFGGAKTQLSGHTHSGTASSAFCVPMGVITPATWMSLNANRYFHRFGVTNEDCGRAVVATRRYAANNPAAWYYQRPITLDDHQNSRWIIEPTMRLLDCCQETDGAVAVIVTSTERARDLRQAPAVIEAAAMSAIFESEVATDHYRADLSVMDTTVHLGRKLFGEFDVPREAIGAAMIYDAFSPLLLMQLEALGFCGLGEAKDFIADGNIDIDGRLPVNTNGGLIGEGYIHGLNLVLEAVRQLRGVSYNQVRDIEHVLLTSSRGGAILGAG